MISSRPEFSSLVISGEQNPTHLYEQAHDRVGNRCCQEGENHLSATFCSFLLGRVCLEKGNRCPGERNQQANHGTNYRVGQTDKSGNDGDDYVGTRLAHLLLFIHSKKISCSVAPSDGQKVVHTFVCNYYTAQIVPCIIS